MDHVTLRIGDTLLMQGQQTASNASTTTDFIVAQEIDVTTTGGRRFPSLSASSLLSSASRR